jgi:excisionase family DNA binding protein
MQVKNEQHDDFGGFELFHSITGLSKPSMYRKVSNPDESGIPFYRAGKKIRFRRSELVNWLKKG